jgi:hypothetical protein
MNFLDRTIDKINRESKLCVIMGDFNMNLLNIDSHQPTEEFLNTLGTYFFTPHILQPTWITDHSATLIDNIFFNSISHHTISGNLIYDLIPWIQRFIFIIFIAKGGGKINLWLKAAIVIHRAAPISLN